MTDDTPQPGSSLNGLRHVVRALDGVVFADEHDGEDEFVALVEGVKISFLVTVTVVAPFDAAFDFDVAGLGQSAVHGRRVGREVPAAFLGGDIDDAAAAGFLGAAHGLHGELLDARAGSGVGGESAAAASARVRRAACAASPPERPAHRRARPACR